MKIGRNNSGLVISLTETEHAALLHSEFVKVRFEFDSKTNWIRLEKSDDAADACKLSPVSNDKAHAVRLEMHGRNCPITQTFATEHVEARSSFGGVLYGSKPTMNQPLMRQVKGARQTNMANMPGLDTLKEAVQIINNFMKLYGDQMEVNVEGKEVKIRMMLEL